MNRVFVGYDPREKLAYNVCIASLGKQAREPVAVEPIGRQALAAMGLYNRPTLIEEGRQFDVISGAPCATDFALARFWVPLVAQRAGWAAFCDCDFLWRRDPAELFALADPRYAVMVVKHEMPPDGNTKMDNQAQTSYPRKNWSSLILWNLSHAATKPADYYHTVNTRPGRELHAFCWLKDSLIGELPLEWNWLEGVSPEVPHPAAVHYTRGTPDMPGYENAAHADEWTGYARACG